MKVKCHYNIGRNLPGDYLLTGNTPESKFNVEIGHVYPVYGMCLQKQCLYYLVDSADEGRPNWYPAALFEVEDAKLPPIWIFSFFPEDIEYGVSAIWGYNELISSPSHFDGLSERDLSALSIFVQRKEEINASLR